MNFSSPQNTQKWRFPMLLLCLLMSCTSWAQEHRIHLKSGTVSKAQQVPLEKANRLNFVNNQVGNRVFTMIQFRELPSKGVKVQLQEAGIELLAYQPDFAFLVSIPEQFDLDQLRNFQVDYVVPIQPQFKLSRNLANRNYPEHALHENGQIDLTAFTYDGVEKSQLASALLGRGFRVLDQPVSQDGVTVRVPIEAMITLAAIPEVMYLEVVEAPAEPLGIIGRTNHRTNVLSANPGSGWDGTGVVMAIGDDGGINHEDFRGRFTDFTGSLGGSHGDMVAGIAGGAGNLDPTQIGTATGAHINVYYKSYFPHVTNAIDNYLNLGTVITSTSITNGQGGTYSTSAHNLDEDVYDQNVLLHVFAAGNAASTAASNVYGNLVAPDGYRYGNITGGAQAAKHSLTVANVHYDDVRSNGSSRGPCEDGRLKPDISATGAGQTSTGPANGYQSASGTSAAAPGVAGVAAQLYQAYKSYNSNLNPSSGLIKGILLNTADDLGRPGPDFDYGWGRVNARRALEVIENDQFFHGSVDQGGVNDHEFVVPANTKQVKVMVIWLDPEASVFASPALVNDLDMKLITPGSQSYLPWVLDTTASIDSLQKNAVRDFDHLNNMEQVTLDDPVAGTYKVKVNGSTVPMGPQTYYVVYEFIRNEIVLTYPIGGESFVPGETEVLRWDAFGHSGDFALQYSINDGASWTNISSTINGADRLYEWTVPNSITGKARIRVGRAGIGDQSSTFNILGVPYNLNVATAGGSSATISWTPVTGANGYDVFALGPKYMEVIGSTGGTTFTQTGLASTAGNWYSVRARNTVHGIFGRRRHAVQYSHLGNVPSCTDCGVTTINTFPYVQGFESGFGDWCQNQSDELDWTNQSGPTTTSNTGPSAASEGTFYAYVNASGSNHPDKWASLESPCFDLTIYSGASLLFDYHLFGSAMGSLYVDASADNGQTWTNVWAKTGDQGDLWVAESVDLSAFAGGQVILRFLGVTGTGSTSDLAVDNIRLEVQGGCTSPISSFPYIENFDGLALCATPSSPCIVDGGCSLGAGWTNGVGDDLDWRADVETAGGPSGDHTSGTGKFLYQRASECSLSTAYVLGPCFDFTALTHPEVSFWYYLTGQSLSMQVSTDGGYTWSADVWSLSGNQGNDWSEATVALTAYAGASSVRIRFKGYTGSVPFSQMAIDDFGISNNPPPSCPSGISSFPYEENFDGLTACGNGGMGCITDGSCSLGAGWTNQIGDHFDWSVGDQTPSLNTGPTADHTTGTGQFLYTEGDGCFNRTAYVVSPCFDFSGLTSPQVSFWYQLHGVDIHSLALEISTDAGATWSGDIWNQTGDQGNSWYEAQLNLVAYAGEPAVQFRFRGRTGPDYLSDIAIDDFSISNVVVSLCPSAITTFPYQENFDNMTLCGNQVLGCIADGTCSLGAGWTNSLGDDLDWSVNDAATPSPATGPTSDHTSGVGNYLYTEATSCNNSTGHLLSPCFNLSNVTSPHLSFWYHMDGSNMGALSLQISTDGGSTWAANIWNQSGDQGAGWQQALVNLGTYTGEASVQFRFKGTTGSDFQSDMAIDDFSLLAVSTKMGPSDNQTIADEVQRPMLKLYPNPAREQIVLEVADSDSPISFRIMDLVGHQVQPIIPVSSGAGNYEMNVSHLASGTYFLVVQSEDWVQSMKFNIVR